MSATLSQILFLDIETISLTENFDNLPERLKEHWEKKSLKFHENESIEKSYFERAAIYAEFGKILCIGIGKFDEASQKFRVKTLYHESEKELLLEFKSVLERLALKEEIVLCAHNGKEFDFPYICRRMLVNQIALPSILDITNKKPWEIKHLDTMEMWKFGDYKSFTSLDLLASVFEIPSSKNDISGAEVNKVFYKEKGLQKIIDYCKEDVVVLAQLYCKLRGIDFLDETKIERVK